MLTCGRGLSKNQKNGSDLISITDITILFKKDISGKFKKKNASSEKI